MTGSKRNEIAAVTVVVALAMAPGVMAQTSAIDPAATQILSRMTDYTSELERFSVHTENTLEDLLETGQRVDFDVAASVTVRRPNRIRAERVGELVDQSFFYDGESLTYFLPDDGVFSTQAAPETIDEVLDFAREALGLVIPVSDLVYSNSFAILMEDVTSAAVVGKSVIGGVTCDHLAFRHPDVDFQVWVADAGPPLPYKYVVTDTSTPELVSAVTVMSNWNLAPAAGDALFEFVPPAGAIAIPFVPLEETSGFGR